MKKSTPKGKSAARSKKHKPEPTSENLKKPEIEGLLIAEQPLFYYGPPPAIKALYDKQIFDKDFHPQDLLAHMREGHTKSEVVSAWGITYSIFNEWLERFPELASAYAVGRPAFDAYHKRALRYSAFGQLKTVRENSLFFMLKNQAGFDEGGGNHEYNDGATAELVFIDENE